MVKEMGCFTPSHAVLKVLYLQDLPPYKCASWEGIQVLGPEQQTKFEVFLKNHANDIQMSPYSMGGMGPGLPMPGDGLSLGLCEAGGVHLWLGHVFSNGKHPGGIHPAKINKGIR